MSVDPDADLVGYGYTLGCRPCALCDLRGAITLLDLGLVGPAARLVADAVARSVPAALRDAHARGWADALHELAEALAAREIAKPPRRPTRDVALVARAVLGPGLDAVLETLRLDPPDLLGLLYGTVTLAPSQRERIRALLAAARDEPNLCPDEEIGPARAAADPDPTKVAY